jgi:hypothetical protein
VTRVPFARSPEVHRLLHRRLGGWFAEQRWRKRPGSTCAYVRQREDGSFSALWVQVSQWGGSWCGSEFTLNLTPPLEAADAPLLTGTRPLRRLSVEDSATARELERRIVLGIPVPLPDHWIHAERAAPGRTGDAWREAWDRAFTPHPARWRAGDDAWLRYYSVGDVDRWAAFLLDRLPRLVPDDRLPLDGARG